MRTSESTSFLFKVLKSNKTKLLKVANFCFKYDHSLMNNEDINITGTAYWYKNNKNIKMLNFPTLS